MCAYFFPVTSVSPWKKLWVIQKPFFRLMAGADMVCRWLQEAGWGCWGEEEGLWFLSLFLLKDLTRLGLKSKWLEKFCKSSHDEHSRWLTSQVADSWLELSDWSTSLIKGCILLIALPLSSCVIFVWPCANDLLLDDFSEGVSSCKGSYYRTVRGGNCCRFTVWDNFNPGINCSSLYANHCAL